MTDEQIIKALECCNTFTLCIDCPYHDVPYCDVRVVRDALALINRQRAEIARARAEAAQEFAERLDNYLVDRCRIEENHIKTTPYFEDSDAYIISGRKSAFTDVKLYIARILQELTEEQE